MKEETAGSSSRTRFFRAARLAFFSAAMLGLAACSGAGPPAAEYVLGKEPAATVATVSQTGLPVIELEHIQIPDYLDTTDILERTGNRLVPSATGRWGERLSVGMSRALTMSLAARLPQMVVTATPPSERPARQVLVNVAAFESRTDHQVILVARWSIIDGGTRRILVAEQSSLVEPIADDSDGAVVAAMSQAVEHLADRIAAGIESSR